MTKSRSIEITFDTEQQVTQLKIVASLNATNELGETAIEIVAGNVQVTAGPRGAEIRAHVKARPVVRRDHNRCRRCFCRHVGGMSDSGSTDRREHTNSQKQVLHGVPEGNATKSEQRNSITITLSWLSLAEHRLKKLAWAQPDTARLRGGYNRFSGQMLHDI